MPATRARRAPNRATDATRLPVAEATAPGDQYDSARAWPRTRTRSRFRFRSWFWFRAHGSFLAAFMLPHRHRSLRRFRTRSSRSPRSRTRTARSRGCRTRRWFRGNRCRRRRNNRRTDWSRRWCRQDSPPRSSRFRCCRRCRSRCTRSRARRGRNGNRWPRRNRTCWERLGRRSRCRPAGRRRPLSRRRHPHLRRYRARRCWRSRPRERRGGSRTEATSLWRLANEQGWTRSSFDHGEQGTCHRSLSPSRALDATDLRHPGPCGHASRWDVSQGRPRISAEAIGSKAYSSCIANDPNQPTTRDEGSQTPSEPRSVRAAGTDHLGGVDVHALRAAQARDGLEGVGGVLPVHRQIAALSRRLALGRSSGPRDSRCPDSLQPTTGVACPSCTPMSWKPPSPKPMPGRPRASLRCSMTRHSSRSRTAA